MDAADEAGAAWCVMPCCVLKDLYLPGCVVSRLSDEARYAFLCGAMAARYDARMVRSVDRRITNRPFMLFGGAKGGKKRKKTAKGEAPGRIVRRDEEPTKGRSSFGSRWTIRRRRGENRRGEVGKPTTRDERDGAGCRFIFPKLILRASFNATRRVLYARYLPFYDSRRRLESFILSSRSLVSSRLVSSRSFSRVVHSPESSRLSFRSSRLPRRRSRRWASRPRVFVEEAQLVRDAPDLAYVVPRERLGRPRGFLRVSQEVARVEHGHDPPPASVSSPAAADLEMPSLATSAPSSALVACRPVSTTIAGSTRRISSSRNPR